MTADATPHLALPYIAANQAQKHVTHNEALHVLDTLVQLAVLDRDLAAPPASPSEGDRYIVAGSPTGLWTGQAGNVAAWLDGAWAFMTPLAGWVAFATDESALLYFDGLAWTDFGATLRSLQNLSTLGVGTTADSTNPFSAKLNKALWTAGYVADGGTGDLRYTLNKEAAARTLSFLLQDNWSGRAEIGLIGDDNLTFKVSPDGAAWTAALCVDRTTGAVSLASPLAVGQGGTGATSAAGARAALGLGTAAVQNTGASGAAIPLLNAANTWSAKATVAYADAQLWVNDTTNAAAALAQVYPGLQLTSAAMNTTNKYTPAVMFGSTDPDFTTANPKFGAAVVGRATESYAADSAGGMALDIFTTPNGPGAGGALTLALSIDQSRAVTPGADNAQTLGTSALRWSTIYAATGTINTSDGRLKTDIADSDLGLDFVLALKPRSFRWICGGNRVESDALGERITSRPGSRRHYGLVAQEVKAALDAAGAPDFAGWTLDDPADPDSLQGLRPDQFIAPLIRAVQELAARLGELDSPRQVRRARPGGSRRTPA